MARLSLAALGVALTFVAASGAHAQPTYDGCFLAGRPVLSIPDPTINDIAMAGIRPGVGPVIVYNPAIVDASLPATRLFFYYHECAHHVLGHTLGFALPMVAEQQADCWAVRELVRRRLFGDAEIRALQSQVATSPGDWSHLPGPVRALNLYACLRG